MKAEVPNLQSNPKANAALCYLLGSDILRPSNWGLTNNKRAMKTSDVADVP